MKKTLTVFILLTSLMAYAQFDNSSEKSAEDEVLGNAISSDAGSKDIPERPKQIDASEELKNMDRAIKDKDMAAIKKTAIAVLGKDERNAEALNALALYYYSNKQNGAAKILLNRAIKFHAGKPALYNNLGIIFLSENDKTLALKYLRKAMDKDPNYEIGGTNLSSIYIEYMDYSRAINKLEDGYDKVKGGLKKGDKKAAQVANNYAIALVGLKDIEKAETIFEKILDSDIRDTKILLNYAIILVTEKKKKQAAYKVLSKIKFISDDPQILKTVSELERMADDL